MLVGGTALAGYHAGHRRSDDSTSQSARQVHDDIVALKQQLMHAFDALARRQPVPSVGALIEALRKRR